MASLTKISKREMKFNKLFNDLNIKLKEGTNYTISYMKDYINNEGNLKIKPIDSNLKNKCIAYYIELPFEILSFSSYVDIEAMDITSSDVEINEYKLLGVKSNELVNALKQSEIVHFLGFYKQFKEKFKIKYANIDEELLKYLELDKKELDYMTIEKFKDSLQTILKNNKNNTRRDRKNGDN